MSLQIDNPEGIPAFSPGLAGPRAYPGLMHLAVTLALAVFLCGCRKAPPAVKQALPEVTVMHPASEPVLDYIDLTGTVAPSRSVDLVARVTGYLESANFEEGTWVEEGRTLFSIEPDSYEQQLALAKASLLRAKSEYDRQVGLLKQNATSEASVERWLSERDKASADVEIAKLNLSYTRVAAPFSGIIGKRQVDPGNLVGPSVNTKLATLDQITPVYVYFNMNERDVLRLREFAVQSGIKPRSGVGKAPVLVGLQNHEGFPYSGVLDFVGVAMSTSSGTLALRAVLTNQDKALFAGLFARVRIPLGEPQPMLVIPNSAIGNDQEGDYVLVVETNDLVARRGIGKGPLAPRGCAIRSGLTAEDRVIVRGLGRVRPGAQVTLSLAGGQRAAAGATR